MPKPLLKGPQQAQQGLGSMLSATPRAQTGEKQAQMNKLKIDQLLRQKRSKAYMDAIHSLDAGGHVHNEQQVKRIMDALAQEFPLLELSGILLGIVSRCYLGAPYEVHSLDITGSIIEHYKAWQVLPGGMEKARAIAIRGGYEFIEVYADCCRAVSSSGAVSVIQG